MKLLICFIPFLIAAPLAYCGQDLDLRLGAVAGAKTPGERGLSNWAPVADLRYRCAIPLPQSFSILLGEEFRCTSKLYSVSPLPELNHPVNAITTAGLEYAGFGTIQVKGFSHVLHQSTTINFPVAKQDTRSPLYKSSMSQRFKNGADLFLILPLWRFTLAADALYNDMLFDLSRDTIIPSDTITIVEKDRHEADAWIRASCAYDVFPKRLSLKAAVLHKNDLNDYKGYTLTGYFAGIEGNAAVFSNSLVISGDAFARWYESEIMALKGYQNRPGSLSHLRLVVKIPSGLYLKGDHALETAAAMYKFRSELAMRKAWVNQSAVEGGIWITGGGLVTRQCAYISSTIAVSPRDRITPVAKVYAGYYGGQDSTIHLYRSDVGMVFQHDLSALTMSLMKNLSFNCGATYRQLIRKLPYEASPQNVDLFVGISGWL